MTKFDGVSFAFLDDAKTHSVKDQMKKVFQLSNLLQ